MDSAVDQRSTHKDQIYCQDRTGRSTYSLAKYYRQIGNLPFKSINNYQRQIHTRYIPGAAAPDPENPEQVRPTKPIDAFLVLSRPFLNALTDVESIIHDWSRLFHLSMTRSQKKWRLTSRLHLFFAILFSRSSIITEGEHAVKTDNRPSFIVSK